MSEDPLDYQIGGDHYQRLGQYQPWLVLKSWFDVGLPVGNEAFLAGEAVVYLCRFITDAPGKGGIDDLEKALHSLEYLRAILRGKEQMIEPARLERARYHLHSQDVGNDVLVECRNGDRAFVRFVKGGGGFWTTANKLSPITEPTWPTTTGAIIVDDAVITDDDGK